MHMGPKTCCNRSCENLFENWRLIFKIFMDSYISSTHIDDTMPAYVSPWAALVAIKSEGTIMILRRKIYKKANRVSTDIWLNDLRGISPDCANGWLKVYPITAQEKCSNNKCSCGFAVHCRNRSFFKYDDAVWTRFYTYRHKLCHTQARHK